MNTSAPNQKNLSDTYLLINLRKQSKLSQQEFSDLLGIGITSYKNIENEQSEIFLRTTRAIQMLTQWSLDWIVNQKKVFPNDGDAEFFMKVVEQYKLTKDVVPTYQYAVDQSAGKTDKSVHINGSQNQVFQKAAVGNNLGEGTLSIGSLIFKSELTETEKLAILQMNEEVTQLNGEVKYLMAEIEGMKKLLAAKEEVISALKGQNK